MALKENSRESGIVKQFVAIRESLQTFLVMHSNRLTSADTSEIKTTLFINLSFSLSSVNKLRYEEILPKSLKWIIPYENSGEASKIIT
jgi:hypothetical protein